MGGEKAAEVVACGDLRGHESQPEMEERMAREAGGWFLCREWVGREANEL